MLRRTFQPLTKSVPLLFTPGPLTTSATVKAAMQHDYGSRDSIFVSAVAEMRQMLLDVGGVSADEWSAIPLQGSGTMGIEAVLSTTCPRQNPHALVFRNGAYGVRMNNICQRLGIATTTFDTEEGKEVCLDSVLKVLKEKGDTLTNVGIVHCETSTGILNPVQEVNELVRKHAPKASVFCDAMSSFGGVRFNVDASCDVMVSSSNKCIQGVPGFSVILARKSLLAKCKDNSRSFTLDLVSQVEGLDKTGQFNYTPPVQSIMAFRQALEEHKTEGGTAAREARYRKLCTKTAEGMKAYGFTLFLDETRPSFGPIITSYNMPTHANWDFTVFYKKLAARGFVLYPGKASNAPTFRIGSIGDLKEADVDALLKNVGEVLTEMNVKL